MPGLTDSFYGWGAGLYDALATAPGVGSWRERAADSLELSPGETVLEVGCGTGVNFTHLRNRVGPTGAVVGVDLVPAMLERARARIWAAGWENVQVVRADATKAPADGVDAMLAAFLIGMLEEPARAVRAWVDRTAPGGRVTLLNAVRSERLLARPLNPLFRTFVRLGAPGRRLQRASPAHALERRYERARTALFETTVDAFEWRLGGGFVALASGRVPE